MATPVKIRATVRQVVRHGDSVASYRFTPHGRVPKFHAGQFMHLALDSYSPDRPWPESRVFSIASPTSERATELAVTIAVKGGYTRRILDTLEEGSECWLKLPYGEFLFPSDRPLTLVAGGVGITPFLSLLGRLLEEKSVQPVQLFYGVRSAPLYLFGDLIGRCRAALPGFTEDVYCEDGSLPGAGCAGSAWTRNASASTIGNDDQVGADCVREEMVPRNKNWKTVSPTEGCQRRRIRGTGHEIG